MGSMISILFWLSIALVVYTWLCYPLLLWSLVRLQSKKQPDASATNREWPSISIIVPVHNGAHAMARKIENLLSLEYPAQIEVLIGSDGSTDNTGEIVERFSHPSLKLVRFDRLGKTSVQNGLVEQASGDILLFTDVDSLFDRDTLRNLVVPFHDQEVGCVTGRVEWLNTAENATAKGGNIYWAFEKRLWAWENDLDLLTCGAGTCLAVLRSLFVPMIGYYGEDSIVPLDIVEQGYKVKYAASAVVYDAWAEDPGSEFMARVRMTLRSFSGTVSKKNLLNPFKYPRLAWSIYSHKIFRWLTPYFLILALLANSLLIEQGVFFRVVIVAQIVGYTLGIIGIASSVRGKDIPVLSQIGSLLLVLFSFALGVYRATGGTKLLAYQPVAVAGNDSVSFPSEERFRK